jgi:hypothetical protein
VGADVNPAENNAGARTNFGPGVNGGTGSTAGAGTGANPVAPAATAGPNVNAPTQPGALPPAPGVNVTGPQGGNVQVQPSGPAGADVNIQGPRGGNINVQPGTAGVNANVGVGVTTGGDADRWRYRWDGGRWWYYGPNNAWRYYDNGQWTDYAPEYGGADSNFRYSNGNWWYWTNNGWLLYQNGQWITPGPGVSAYTDYGNEYYYRGYPGGYRDGYYGYYGGFPYRYWNGAVPGPVGRTGAAIGRAITGRR